MNNRFTIYDFRFTIFALARTFLPLQEGPRSQSAIFFVIFVTLSILVRTSEIAFADSSTENSQALPLTMQTDPNGLQRLEMLRAETSLPKSREAKESKDKLKQLIEQVRSVRFESVGRTTEASAIHGKPIDADQGGIPMPEPNEILSTAPRQKTKEAEQTPTESPHERVTEQTLKRLNDLLQHPDKLNDPFELGEVLFASGNPKDAMPFYQEALRRIDPNSVSSSRDRAWILFQMGNCLRTQEPPSAAEIYKQLLIECPNSPWADIAKAQKELIEWRLKEEPQDLIAETGKDL